MTIATTNATAMNDGMSASTTNTAPGTFIDPALIVSGNQGGKRYLLTPNIPGRDKSPVMAVLPLNPSAKLDQEPNPFEQSFSSAATETPNTTASADKLPSRPIKADGARSGSQSSNVSSSSGSVASSQGRTVLPPVAALTSPAPPLLESGILPKDISSQLAWDSLRTGPLSPSMLQRPAQPSTLENYNLTAISNSTSGVINPAVTFNQSNHPSHPQHPATVFMNSGTLLMLLFILIQSFNFLFHYLNDVFRRTYVSQGSTDKYRDTSAAVKIFYDDCC